MPALRPARFRPALAWLAPGLILAVYGALALDAARKLSPAWDEIAYPAAGLAQLRTGSIDLIPEHPPLARLFFAAPLLALRPALPFAHPSWEKKDPFQFGFQFIFRNGVPAGRLIFWSRVPAVLFSLAAALLLFLWIRPLWGTAGACVGLLCCAATPIFLSRAGLALQEAPLYFFILLSFRLYDGWARGGSRTYLYAGGLAMGAALLCKMTALPAMGALLAGEMLVNPRKAALGRRTLHCLLLTALAGSLFAVFYIPFQGGEASFRLVLSTVFRFRSFPLYFYWNGHNLTGAPSLLSWAAWLVKAPPFVVALGFWGGIVWFRSRLHRSVLAGFVLLSSACWLSALFFDNALSTVQLSPLYLGIAGAAGALGPLLVRNRRARWAGALLLLGAAADAWRVHPHYLSYFNLFAGGPDRGYRWLADSDQDWGQGLPALSDLWRRRGSPGLVLAYAGAGDPRAYGLRYQDLFSPALVSRDYPGELLPPESPRILLAVGTKVLQSEERLFGWLRENVRPIAMAGSCFLVYDVSENAEAFRWMGHVYAATRRPQKARWAFARARRLDPGRGDDGRPVPGAAAEPESEGNLVY